MLTFPLKIAYNCCMQLFYVVFWGFFWGCNTSPQSKTGSQPVDANAAGCDKYQTNSEAYGYCLFKESEQLRDIKTLQAYCAKAGDWEGDCIYNWVTTKIAPDSGYTRLELIELCGDIKDCAFRVVDYRPAENVLDTLELCRKHVRRNVRACSMHAMLRWWLDGPSATDVASVMQATSDPTSQISYYVAARVQCDGVGECVGSSLMEEKCKMKVGLFKQDPDSCPRKKKTRNGWSLVPTKRNDRKRRPSQMR